MKEYFNGFSTQDLVDMRRNDEKRKEKVEMEKEIERLHSIIKEVRELLQKANIYRNYDDDEDDTWYTDLNIDEALEILDKESK